MKIFKLMACAMLGFTLASCMGDGYDEPVFSDGNAPYGNAAIKETNVISIAELKNQYKSVIANNRMDSIKTDLQIKGVVTGNDLTGNLYNQIVLQDATGGILIKVAAGGLYGYLPVGQEVVIDLKGLWVGGYGKQANLGKGIYTSASGTQSVGSIDRFVWQNHFKLVGQADKAKALALVEDFDLSKLNDAAYLDANVGKLMTFRKVTFTDGGKKAWAPKADAVNNQTAVNRTFKGYSDRTLVARTSTFCDFANALLPEGLVNITAIVTRFNNTVQLTVLSPNDVEPTVLAYFSEAFAEENNSFTVNDIQLPEGATYVWKWGTYGSDKFMKASAFVNKTNLASQSRLESPAIDLSAVKKATLSFEHTGKYFSANMKDDIKVQVSTDKKNWETLTISAYPSGNDFNFVKATADLNKYVGKKTVYIGFLYTSTTAAAGTWEVKNVTID